MGTGLAPRVRLERVAAMIGWILVALAASGLVAVGVGALVAPRASASQYGIVVDDPRALAFIRAMGIRDLVIGVLLALLASSRSRELVAWALYATTLIALIDFAVVTIDRRTTVVRDEPRGIPSRVLHAAGAIGLGLAGVVLQAGY
jgi:hypothetical protein